MGLRDDSRVKMNLKGLNITTSEMLLAGIHDVTSLILYSQTEDAAKGRNYPKLILQELQNTKGDIQSFNSGEEFERERERILRG